MKRLAILIFSGALCLSAFYNWKLSEDKKVQDQTIEQQAQRLRKLEGDLKKVRARFQADADAQRKVVESVRQQLQIERDNLAAIGQQRDRARNGGVGGDDPAFYGDRIERETEAVLEIERQLKQIRDQETGLASSGKTALGQTRWNESQDSEALDASIQAGQQNLASLTGQFRALQPHQFDFGVKDQMAQLKQQIAAQRSQLQQLKTQRNQLNQQDKAQEGEIKSSVNDQQSKLKASEGQLRQQLQSEKAALADLKSQQSKARDSQNAQKANITQLEKAWQDQKAKVEQLQAQLKDEETRLEELTL